MKATTRMTECMTNRAGELSQSVSYFVVVVSLTATFKSLNSLTMEDLVVEDDLLKEMKEFNRHFPVKHWGKKHLGILLLYVVQDDP